MIIEKRSLLSDNSGSYSAQLNKTHTILLHIVMALFHKSYLSTTDITFESKVLDTIDEYLPQAMTSEGSIARVNTTLIDVIKAIIIRTSKDPITKEWLLIQLEPLSVDHENVINKIVKSIKDLEDLDKITIKKRFDVYTGFIYEYQMGFLLKQKAKELFAKSLNASEENVANILKTAFKEIEPLLVVENDNPIISVKGMDDIVISNDEDAVKAKFKEASESVDPASVLKCGIQGWDRSFSDYGGGLRGTFGEIQALSGHGKTDTMRRLLRGFAMNNTPYMIDPKLKPAMVYISLEDPTFRTIDRIVQQLRREESNSYDLPPMDEDEKCAYFKERMGCKGYTVILVKARNKELTAGGVIEILDKIKGLGYEIHLGMIDYMGCLDVTDIDEANNSESVKTAHSRVMNYMQENKIFGIAANQVAGAKYEKIVGNEAQKDGIKFGVHQNLSAQSNNIINVLDFRVLVNVVKGPNAAYHQWAMGKARHSTSVPSKDMYAVYKMHSAKGEDGIFRPAGFILADGEGPCMALRTTPDMDAGYGDDDDEDFDIGSLF